MSWTKTHSAPSGRIQIKCRARAVSQDWPAASAGDISRSFGRQSSGRIPCPARRRSSRASRVSCGNNSIRRDRKPAARLEDWRSARAQRLDAPTRTARPPTPPTPPSRAASADAMNGLPSESLRDDLDGLGGQRPGHRFQQAHALRRLPREPGEDGATGESRGAGGRPALPPNERRRPATSDGLRRPELVCSRCQCAISLTVVASAHWQSSRTIMAGRSLTPSAARKAASA